jgi:hypothetical protein
MLNNAEKGEPMFKAGINLLHKLYSMLLHCFTLTILLTAVVFSY